MTATNSTIATTATTDLTQQQRAQRQQRLEELCAACIRALAKEPSLHYRARRLYQGDEPLTIRAPHLHTNPDLDGFQDYRGSIDGTALRLTLSDPTLHASLCPKDPVERLIFELLEQLRVETQVPAALPGMRYNLTERFHTWSQRFVDNGMTESSLGLLLFTVAQSCWSRLNGAPLSEKTEDIMEATRAGLSTVLGEPLSKISRTAHDQQAFAPHALAIAKSVSQLVKQAQEDAEDAGRETNDDSAVARAFAMLLEFEADNTDGFEVAATGISKTFEAAARHYAIFTRQFDRQANASDLVRDAQLQELRAQLDRSLGGHAVNVQRLTRQFFALLSQPKRDGFSFGEDEGYIDGARLARLVASPDQSAVFQADRHIPKVDCAVTFLVDCSGSMKTYIDSLAVLLDIMVRALSQAGAATELLGFTTGAWTGGRAHQSWLKQSRPARPGRLNETLHMVFKASSTNWRRARRDIAALLKPDLFREGVDGEAVQWACERLNQQSAKRRILIVVSDGSPMDTATSLANDPHYLDNHLRDVVAQHERARDVEILGLGVGLDLSPYYPRCVAADLSEPIGSKLLNDIVQLISGRHHR